MKSTKFRKKILLGTLIARFLSLLFENLRFNNVSFHPKRRPKSNRMPSWFTNLYICKTHVPHISPIFKSPFDLKVDLLQTYILRSKTIFSISRLFYDRKTKCGPKYADVSKRKQNTQKTYCLPILRILVTFRL